MKRKQRAIRTERRRMPTGFRQEKLPDRNEDFHKLKHRELSACDPIGSTLKNPWKSLDTVLSNILEYMVSRR